MYPPANPHVIIKVYFKTPWIKKYLIFSLKKAPLLIIITSLFILSLNTPEGTRTPNTQDLNLVPLPIGLRTQDTISLALTPLSLSLMFFSIQLVTTIRARLSKLWPFALTLPRLFWLTIFLFQYSFLSNLTLSTRVLHSQSATTCLSEWSPR